MAGQLINYLESFTFIEKKDKLFIENVFDKREYREGDYLIDPNSISRELFFVCKGVSRITVVKEKGNVVTNFFFKENQFCTILKSFTNQTPAVEAIQAACNIEVLVISKENLLLLNDNLPYIGKLIDQIIQRAVLDKVELRNSYLGLDSTARYQLFLKQQPQVAKLVSLSSIASYLGITQQSLSRIRKNTH
ncbi:Crp/Fnr family transcriptional regulator [Flavobacterium anhuiense]|uniref:Crp/Fnr family transcriptional regulator n=1 Tax=Flavobacterium anhuiense TaxID=459526 RepID=UPI002026D5DD|nr:cyclic nucleotide-binding domain-containing protein [Flavobacterium anhuiense]URM35713.1 cyclic nucleotide-binding domain-containing protein [Flavobacterium anhuiense]